MTISKVIEAANAAIALQDKTVTAKEEFRRRLVVFCDETKGAESKLADMIDVSAQYLNDVRHRRRKVSDALVARLGRLK